MAVASPRPCAALLPASPTAQAAATGAMGVLRRWGGLAAHRGRGATRRVQGLPRFAAAKRGVVVGATVVEDDVSKVGEDDVSRLKEGIAQFYDASSGVWEEMWGEHMHHGFYGADGAVPGGEGGKMEGHQRAQIEMIEKSLAWAGVGESGLPPRTILDVGCGIGGSARYLSRKFPGADVKGITLSPRQAQRGTELCAAQGLDDRVQVMVADAMSTPFEDSSFDLLWSMESGEHMPDKRQFVAELARVAAPGGKLIIVTWCHRNLDVAAGETQLQNWEQELLQQICDAYYLPAWCSMDDYVQIAHDLGLKKVTAADWTENVTPFWPAVIASALTWEGLLGLLKSGWTTVRGALAMLLMVRGYSRGVIKFVIISAEKGAEA